MSEDLVTDRTCYVVRISAKTIHFVSQGFDFPTVKDLWQLYVATMVVPNSDVAFHSLASIIEWTNRFLEEIDHF